MAKKKNSLKANYTSPKITLVYPAITQPDSKYGNYKTDISFANDEDAVAFRDLCKNLAIEKGSASEGEKFSWNKSKPTAKTSRLYYGSVMLPMAKNADGEITGCISTKFAPAVFDPFGNKYPESEIPKIGGGTTARVKAVLLPSDNGSDDFISAKFRSVQIIGLREYGNDGFDSAEDMIDDGDKVVRAPANTGTPPAATVNPNDDDDGFEPEDEDPDADSIEADQDW